MKSFLAEMKKSLSQFNYERIIQALQSYKKTKDLDVLLTETAVLTEDANTHRLLRGKTSDVKWQPERPESVCLSLHVKFVTG